MRASSDTPAKGEAPAEPKRSRLKVFVGAGIAAVALLGGLSVAGADDVIDLPAWANIDGVDVPLIGDLDQIDCRLEQVAGTTDVQITIVDGDESTYADFIYVFNNGEIHDLDDIARVSPDVIISPSREYFGTQYYSIADEPLEESRVFCSMIDVVDPNA